MCHEGTRNKEEVRKKGEPNCIGDEGRSFGAKQTGQAPNNGKLLAQKQRVVNISGKGTARLCHVGTKEANAKA